MKSLLSRIVRLEAIRPDPNKLQETVRYFWMVVAEKAAVFDDASRHMCEEERVAQLTPTEHLGWLQRFGGEADLRRVYGLHGTTAPNDWLSFVLAAAYCPGDESLL